MIDRLLLFGATGDLAGRYVVPALAALHAAAGLEGRAAYYDQHPAQSQRAADRAG